MTPQHPDCARPCLYWEDGCKKGHTPPENPYATCFWCNTDPNKKPDAKPAQTQRLF